MLRTVLYIGLSKLKKDITARIMIVIELVLIIFLLNLMVGNWRYHTYIQNLVEDMNLYGGYYCSGELNSEGLEAPIEIGEVKETFAKFQNNKSLPIFVYNDVIVDHMPLQLSEGNWFNEYEGKELPIILSASFAQQNNIKVNQIIQLKLQSEDSLIDENYSFRVIGILNKSNYYLSFSVSGTELMWNNLFKQDSEIGLLTDQHIRGEIQNSKMIFLKETDENNNYLMKELKNQAYLTSSEQLSENTKGYVTSILRQQLILWLMVLGITVSTLTSNNILEKIFEENEFATYYMLGLKWQACVLTEVIRSIMQLLFACGVAFVLIQVTYGRNNNTTLILDGYNYLISAGVIFIIYVISSLWILIEFYRTSPIELIRRNEK